METMSVDKRRIFIVQTARFCVGEPNVYVIQGFFRGNEADGIHFKAYLDGVQLKHSITVRKGAEISAKYIRMGLEAYGIDREYDLWLKLPENLKSARSLCVFQYLDGKKQRICRMSGDRLRKEQKRPQSYLESWKREDNKIIVGGWAIGNASCKIRVFCGPQKEIPAEVRWHCRRDVNAAFPELQRKKRMAEELQAGFEVSFEKPESRNVKLVVTSKGQREIYRISVKGSGGDAIGNRAVAPSYLTKAIAYFRQNGLERTIKRSAEKLLHMDMGIEIDYNRWRKKNLPTKEELEAQREHVFDDQPLISIVVPLYRTPEKYLQELIASVRKQTYGNWELCLSDGSGADSPLLRILSELEKDSRIHVVRSEQPLGISENTNAALKIASGDFIAFADHDDLLAENALYECVKTLNEHPEAEILYTDEDKISMDGKEYFQPHFKSDFNIDLLCSMNYFCHLVVVKKELQERVGMLDPAYNGAQDYDFVLRCVEQTGEIYHIPKALYHWRAHKDSTAENPESKRYAFEAGARAIQAHYERVGIDAHVEQGQYPGLYHTCYEIPQEKPLISVIIPNKDHVEDLQKCLDSILQKSSYENLEFIIVENNSTQEETFVFYRQLEREYENIRVVYWKEEFNYSLINNFGVGHAKGEYLLFLNNDIEMINADCMEELLGPGMRPEVGVVGARLYYQDHTIQHAGVIIGFGGIAGHAFIGSRGEENGYFSRIICTADLSAVTAACMMVKRSVFEAVNGFDGSLRVAFNDIDFCLRVRRLGKLVVYNPFAELYHYESKSRGYEDTPQKVARFSRETDDFQKRWQDILQEGDPYYNPNFTLDKADFSLKQ